MASVLDEIRDASFPEASSAIPFVDKVSDFIPDGQHSAAIPEDSPAVIPESAPAEMLSAIVSENPTDADNAATAADDSAKEKERPFMVCEVLPEFVGGEKAMIDYLVNNIKYPEECQKEGIEGRVIVKFVVEKDGSIGEAQVLRGVHPALDAEAIRVVKGMKFTPGMNNGKPVASWFTLPVSYKIPKEKSEKSTSRTESSASSTPTARNSSISTSTSVSTSGGHTETSTTVRDSDSGSMLSYNDNGKSDEKLKAAIHDSDRVFIDGKQLTGSPAVITRKLNAIDASKIAGISVDKSKRDNGVDLYITMKH